MDLNSPLCLHTALEDFIIKVNVTMSMVFIVDIFTIFMMKMTHKFKYCQKLIELKQTEMQIDYKFNENIWWWYLYPLYSCSLLSFWKFSGWTLLFNSLPNKKSFFRGKFMHSCNAEVLGETIVNALKTEHDKDKKHDVK